MYAHCATLVARAQVDAYHSLDTGRPSSLQQTLTTTALNPGTLQQIIAPHVADRPAQQHRRSAEILALDPATGIVVWRHTPDGNEESQAVSGNGGTYANVRFGADGVGRLKRQRRRRGLAPLTPWARSWVGVT